MLNPFNSCILGNYLDLSIEFTTVNIFVSDMEIIIAMNDSTNLEINLGVNSQFMTLPDKFIV